MRRQAAGFGLVGSEWRVYLCDDPANRTSLVPGIAYVSRERLRGLSERAVQKPQFAPDVAVEIRSPDDRERDIDEKIALYLRYGSVLVLDVDLDKGRIVAHSRYGKRTFERGETFEHEEAPWLRFEIAALFDATKTDL